MEEIKYLVDNELDLPEKGTHIPKKLKEIISFSVEGKTKQINNMLLLI